MNNIYIYIHEHEAIHNEKGSLIKEIAACPHPEAGFFCQPVPSWIGFRQSATVPGAGSKVPGTTWTGRWLPYHPTRKKWRPGRHLRNWNSKKCPIASSGKRICLERHLFWNNNDYKSGFKFSGETYARQDWIFIFQHVPLGFQPCIYNSKASTQTDPYPYPFIFCMIDGQNPTNQLIWQISHENYCAF